MIEMKSVTMEYKHRVRDVVALDRATVEIPGGQFVSVVGPSGSGKSTLLLMIGGMLTPTSGRVLLGGESIYDLSPDARARLRRREIGFLFQTFNLVPYLTALENVQLPLLIGGKNGDGQARCARELLDRVGLADRADHKPSELSVGQQQRVALARVLANDPAIVLADEPTGNLDPKTREQVLEFLGEFHREGRTIVMVTHDPEAAVRGERTLHLEEGRIVG
ncbi:MAG: ABC transporter ATP-binding protein [Candidatus Eisenbacteria bacterium]